MNIIQNEEILISNLLQNNYLLESLALKPYMFSTPAHQNFISFVLKQNKVNLNQIYHEAQRNNEFLSIDKIGHLANADYTSPAFFRDDQVIILEHYKKTKAMQLNSEFLQTPELYDIKELAEQLEALDQLSIHKEDKTEAFISEVLHNIMDDNPTLMIKTGINSIDRKITGFEPGQLNVIAARPSVGKTGLALQMILNIARQGYETTFFSIETSGRGVIERLSANLSGVDLTKFKNPKELSEQDINHIMLALDGIKKLPINIEYSALTTVDEIRMQAMKQSERQQVIVIDYIQIMKSTNTRKDRREQIEEISRELKTIATESQAVIILVAQIGRGAESRQNKRPMLSDIKESGSIEQDANMVFMLYRDDYYDDEKADIENGVSVVECNIAKNKDGETGIVELDYYKKTQRFYSHDFTTYN